MPIISSSVLGKDLSQNEYATIIKDHVKKMMMGDFTFVKDGQTRGTDMRSIRSVYRVKKEELENLRKKRESVRSPQGPLGETASEEDIDSYLLSVSQQEDAAFKIFNEFDNVIRYVDDLVRMHFDIPVKYALMVEEGYHPTVHEYIQKEVDVIHEAIYQNEYRYKDEKVVDFYHIRTGEGLEHTADLDAYQLSYVSTKGFLTNKLKLLSMLDEYMREFKYIESGNYRSSSLENLGFKGQDKIPLDFIRWANMSFHPELNFVARECILEMMKLTFFDNDVRMMADLYAEVYDLLRDFVFIHQEAREQYSHFSDTQWRALRQARPNFPLIVELNMIVDEINAIEDKYHTSIFKFGNRVIPKEYYFFVPQKEDEAIVKGSASKKAQEKMLDILDERILEYNRIFPNQKFNVDNERNKAYYLFKVDPLIKEVAGYFEERENELTNALKRVYVNQAEKDLEDDTVESKDYEERVNVLLDLNPILNLKEFIDEVENFSFEDEMMNQDIARLDSFIKDLKKERVEILKQDTVESEEIILGIDMALIPLLETALKEKSNIYKYMRSVSYQQQKEKQIEQVRQTWTSKAMLGLSSAFPMNEINTLKYRNPIIISGMMGSINIADRLNAANSFFRTMLQRDDASLPLSKNVILTILSSDDEGHDNYQFTPSMSLTIEYVLSKKLLEMMSSMGISNISPEFNFWKFLLERFRYNFKSRFIFRSFGSVFEFWNDNKQISEKVRRIYNFYASPSYDRNFFWSKLFKAMPYSSIQKSLILEDGEKIPSTSDYGNAFLSFMRDIQENPDFSSIEKEVIKHSLLDLPDINFIDKYSNENDLLYTDAVAQVKGYVSYYVDTYLKTNAPAADKTIGNNPYYNEYGMMKEKYAEFIRICDALVKADNLMGEEFFTEYLDYLKHYEAVGSDEGWQGKYAYLLKDEKSYLEELVKQQAEDPLLGGVNLLPSMEVYEYRIDENGNMGFFKKIFRAIAKPFKAVVNAVKSVVKSVVKVVKAVVRPIVKVVSVVVKPVVKAVTEVASFVASNAARAFKEIKRGVYKVIPKETFSALGRILKMPYHLVTGKIKISDLKNIARDMVTVFSGFNIVGRIGGQLYSKGMNFLIKNVSLIRKIDEKAGGLLSSSARLANAQHEIANGRKIDRDYLITLSFDALKVGAFVVAGGTVAAMATNLATTAGANAVVDAAGLEGTTAGRIVSGVIGGTVVGGGFVNTVQSVAKQEAQASVAREATRSILKAAGMEDSDIARLATQIGVQGTVQSIQGKQGFNEYVLEQAQVVAVQHAKAVVDKQLAKIHPALSIENYERSLKLYDDVQNFKLDEFIQEKSDRLNRYIAEGEIYEDAEKEVERWAKKEVKKIFDKQLDHLSDEFYDFLYDKHGPQYDYERFITPETYVEYVDYILETQRRRQVIEVTTFVEGDRKQNVAALIGAGALTLAAIGAALA
jgi:hypothetical protein